MIWHFFLAVSTELLRLYDLLISFMFSWKVLSKKDSSKVKKKNQLAYLSAFSFYGMVIACYWSLVQKHFCIWPLIVYQRERRRRAGEISNTRHNLETQHFWTMTSGKYALGSFCLFHSFFDASLFSSLCFSPGALELVVYRVQPFLE